MIIDYESNPTIARALLLAKAMHFGQTYGNKDYVDFHLCGVAELAVKMPLAAVLDLDIDLDLVITVAILHDILEDTPCTFDILSILFGERAATEVALLTKSTEISHNEYISRIIRSPIARLVKIADTSFNLTQSSLGCDAKRIAKYTSQLLKLVGMSE